MSQIKIPDRIVEEIAEIAKYADSCDDWVTIKKEIMKSIPSSLRRNFSTRHPITKEQVPNEFDKAVIEHYRKVTGITLKVRTRKERKNIN